MFTVKNKIEGGEKHCFLIFSFSFEKMFAKYFMKSAIPQVF